MITSQDKELISRLIKKYAGNLPTGAMIAFVADTNGMLSICKMLVSTNNNDDQMTISWVDEQCHQRNVDVRGFLYEVEQIVALFQPGQKVDEHYSTLNLDSGASEEEIKSAYRQLIRKYHPDTASSANAANGEMFGKITKAYHALLKEEKSTNSIASTPPVNQWREQKKNRVSRERKRKSLLWFAVLAIVLIVVSLIVANNYKKKLMIAGLQSNRGAFIPPESTVAVQDEEDDQLLTDEKNPVLSIEIESDKVEKVVATQVQRAENTDQEVEQIPVAPTEDPPPSGGDLPETPIAQIQPHSGTLAKNTKQPVPAPITKEIAIVVLVEDQVKQKVEERLDSTKIEPVVQKIVHVPKKQKPVVIPIVKKAPVVLMAVDMQEQTQRKIEDFLSDYTKSYEEKDLLSFTRFFDLDAMENGVALAKILPTYSDLFQKADTILFEISVLKWEDSENILNMEGRFNIRIRYQTGDTIQGAGPISFLMRDMKGRLSIKEITYKFDNQ